MAQKPTVAVIGASANRAKFGNKCVRAHIAKGWDVYPVNGRGGQVEGRPAYRSLKDIPAKVDRVSLYLPPKLGMEVLPAVAAARPREFFINPGAESDELVEAAHQLGLDPILACSIVALGVSPDEFA